MTVGQVKDLTRGWSLWLSKTGSEGRTQPANWTVISTGQFSLPDEEWTRLDEESTMAGTKRWMPHKTPRRDTVVDEPR